jgi:hypothetical protein
MSLIGRHREVPDVLVVVPPPSPSDTNPPLGPAVLASACARRGQRVAVLDLNILTLARAASALTASPSRTLGDHGKDKIFVAAVAEDVLSSTKLRSYPPVFLPDVADQAAGMHVSLDSLADALSQAMAEPRPWRNWIEEQLRIKCSAPPSVVGVSVMGPSQVFAGLLTLKIARQIWPGAITVLGGSHITLLADEIDKDRRCQGLVDRIMPGHCEDEFAALVACASGRDGGAGRASRDLGPPFEYFPLFASSELERYPPGTITIPVQFTRGCSYGRCTFCTYPVVEPATTEFFADRARTVIAELVARHGVRRFSVKDSLFTVPNLKAFAAGLLIDPAIEISWSATTKANRALVAAAPLLREAGLATVEIGVETIHRKGQLIFDKIASQALIEDVIFTLANTGIAVVINLIFGYPGELLEDAERQLHWLNRMRDQAPAGRIDCSLNMLDIVRHSPLSANMLAEAKLIGAAPWAYCYAWTAPTWRQHFKITIDATERNWNAASALPFSVGNSLL